MLNSSLFILQHKELSIGAWIALILIIFFVVIINFSLVVAIRKRNNPDANVFHKFVSSIKEPDHTDDKMRQELSERVQRLSKKDTPPKDD